MKPTNENGTTTPAIKSSTLREWWPEWTLMLIALVVFSRSFNDRPIIEREHSVLADADAACFVLLIRDFSLSRKYGDQWNEVNRSTADIAQKHKIHHVLYAGVGSAVYAVARPVYKLAGAAPENAVFAVNALIAIGNILLLGLLMRRPGESPTRRLPFLILYAASLGTWIFASVPESWPFTATLVMLFLLLLRRQPSPWLSGALIGFIMLNNFFLGALMVLVAADALRRHSHVRDAVKAVAVASVAMVAAWLVCLSVLSVFDTDFRPDEFIRYTLWFKQYLGVDLSITSPYVWQSAITNLFINSVVSNQPNPAMPQEALLETLRGSLLGAVATLFYLVLIAAAAVRYIQRVRQAGANRKWEAFLDHPATQSIVWSISMLGLTAYAFYASGFLYSSIVLPLVMLFLFFSLDLRRKFDRWLLHATVVIVLINNVQQIRIFRDALAGLGG